MKKRRNKRLRKKGLSAIVTTLVIILLVLFTSGIIWTVMTNIISEQVKEISLKKFASDLNIKSVKVEGEILSIGVERSAGKGDLVKLKFIFENGTDSEIIERETDIGELDEKSFIFSLGDLSLLNIKKVSIVPIYESSSGEEVGGDIIDIFNLKKPIKGEAGTWEYIGNFEKLGFKGTGREEYSISSQSEDIVKIKKAIVDPVDVLPGDNQTFTVHVYSPYNITGVTTTTELDNSTLNLDLQEIGEEGGNQIFSATWIVNDVHAITYRTTIVATDSEGNSDSVTLTWTDSCQSLIAFSDHGVATKTISSTCTTTASAVGGVDGSNIVIGANVNLIISANSQFIFNSGKSITITASGASITSTSTGSFGNGDLYYMDADGDGYASGTALLIGSGTGRVRASDPSIVGVSDCADGSGNQNIYQTVTTADDTDKDRSYTGSMASRCVGDKSSYWYTTDGTNYIWINDADDYMGGDCSTGNGYIWWQATGTNIDSDQDGYEVGNPGSGVSRCMGGAQTMITVGGRRYYNSADNTFDYQVWSDKLGSNDCNDGSVSIQVNKYYDADWDGYCSSGTPTYCVASGAGNPYRNSCTGYSDCSLNDADAYQNVGSLGRDADQDRYTTGTSTTRCVGDKSSWWYKDVDGTYKWITTTDDYGTGTDCYDSSVTANADLVHPGQTNYYTSPVGGSWWDYDCSGVSNKQYTATYGACERCSSSAFYPNDETPEWESLQEGDGFDWIPLQPEGPEGECFDLGTGRVGWIGTAPACGSTDTYYSNPGDCFVDDCPAEAYNCYWAARTQACR